jgi:hypothetical protein
MYIGINSYNLLIYRRLYNFTSHNSMLKKADIR